MPSYNTIKFVIDFIHLMTKYESNFLYTKLLFNIFLNKNINKRIIYKDLRNKDDLILMLISERFQII